MCVCRCVCVCVHVWQKKRVKEEEEGMEEENKEGWERNIIIVCGKLKRAEREVGGHNLNVWSI